MTKRVVVWGTGFVGTMVIAEIVKHLEAAIPFAPEPTANALRALVQWYRTGNDADRATVQSRIITPRVLNIR